MGGCIGPSSDEEEALACKASLNSPVDSAIWPSVALNETAMQSETVAAEYSVSGFYGPDRPPQMADGFTKGCVGVQPRGKERLDNLEKEDRENRLDNPIP